MNRAARWVRQPVLWAWVGALLLAALYGRVALTHLGQGVVGGDLDGYENLWNNYWVKTALLDGPAINRAYADVPDLHPMSLFYTDFLYYPTGISLRYHTLNPLNGLLTLPLNLLLGYIPTTNLLFLAALALTTGFTFLLLRDRVGNPWIAFAGAALFTYASHNVLYFYTLGQAEKLSVEWLPLYLFCLFRALYGLRSADCGLRNNDLSNDVNEELSPTQNSELRTQNSANSALLPLRGTPAGFPHSALWLGWAAGAVGCLLALALTDWQYVMLAVFTTLLFFAWVLLTRRLGQETRRVFVRLALIGGSFSLLAAPLLIPMLQEAAASPWLISSYQSSNRALDLAAFLVPGLDNPGYLALVLALVGLIGARGAVRWWAGFWALATVLFYVMALGPELIWAGQPTGIPLPYAFLQTLPVFNIGRDPGRYLTIALLGVAHLAAFGLLRIADYGLRISDEAAATDTQHATRNTQQRSRFTFHVSRFTPALLAVAFLAVSLTPFVAAAGAAKIDPPDWPPFYEQIAKDPTPYALLQLPAFTDKGRGENHYMLYQILTNKPIFGGRWARDHKLSNPNNFLKTTTLFRQLLLLDFKPDQRDYYYPEQDFLRRTDYATQGRAILNYYHTRYIVLWKEALDAEWDAEGFAAILAQVLGPGTQPVYEDRLMQVWQVPDGPPAADPLALDVGDGWFPAAARPDGVVYRWADSSGGQPSELLAMNLTHAPLAATLRFTGYTFQQPRTLHISVDGQEVGQVALTTATTPYVVNVTIPPGHHRIGFTSADPPLPTGDPRDKRLLSFGMYGVALTTR